ncbi:hypothetical protein SLUN_18800 [Streptomyces lunaelactis]|uniref:Lipoprotein n=1 Tax=Streptomyces lunaelactis TaxID=1535768 RepID=A0A2R4TEI5_9ACTN|nr:hypothetical protein SLUN_18800 [Streptomyces lunaelactis]
MSVPGRLAVRIAASLALAASAGCMSVSDDEGGKPAPRSSTDRRGAVAEPDGGRGVPGSGQHGSGRGGSDAKAEGGDEASPSPNGPASPSAQPPRGGQRPLPPHDPAPNGGGAPPSVPPPAPPQPIPSEPPSVSPSPQPSEPSDPPSASSAPEVHAGAMRVADGQGMLMEPTASPQVGPM